MRIICLFVTSNQSSSIKFPAEWLSQKIHLSDINGFLKKVKLSPKWLPEGFSGRLLKVLFHIISEVVLWASQLHLTPVERTTVRLLQSLRILVVILLLEWCYSDKINIFWRLKWRTKTVHKYVQNRKVQMPGNFLMDKENEPTVCPHPLLKYWARDEHDSGLVTGVISCSK